MNLTERTETSLHGNTHLQDEITQTRESAHTKSDEEKSSEKNSQIL